MPLILTPRGLADAGRKLVFKFCQVNGLKQPLLIEPTNGDEDPLLRGYYHVNSCAFYRERTSYTKEPAIYVMVDKCARPGYAAQAWSWPGYVIDRTPYGVYAHELGHHIDAMLTKKPDWFCQRIMRASGEPKLTNYCPNPAEWFAEMCRLFITNPDLLCRVRPKTYLLLIQHLQPVEWRPWETVLKGAPERTVAQAAKKITQAQGF